MMTHHASACVALLACWSVAGAAAQCGNEQCAQADALFQKTKDVKLELRLHPDGANEAAPAKKGLVSKFEPVQSRFSPSARRTQEVMEMFPYACGLSLALIALTLAWEFRSLPASIINGRNWCDKAPAPGVSEDSGTAVATDDVQNSTFTIWLKTALPVVFFGILYIVCSATLIKYNKFLMTANRFPYAVNMALGHQVSGSVFLFIMYLVNPSRFTSLQPERRQEMDSGLFMRGLPIAACFGGQLMLSNMAYLYSSVAFLQMMKEGNMFLVYSLSLVAGLEIFQSTQARVLACLALSTALTIEGELSFSFAGFTLQCCSQIMECLKIVWQSNMLSAAGRCQLDPLTYNLLVQPATAAVLTIILIGSGTGLVSNVSMAPWSAYVAWWPHLVANGMVALALNISISLFIANTSAVGFIIAGIIKDVCLISADVVISGTRLSHLQIGAFSLQLLFAGSYSLLKTFSKKEIAPPRVTKTVKS